MKNLFILLVLLISACTTENPQPKKAEEVDKTVTPTSVDISDLFSKSSEGGECSDNNEEIFIYESFTIYFSLSHEKEIIRRVEIFNYGCMPPGGTAILRGLFKALKTKKAQEFRIILRKNKIVKVFVPNQWSEENKIIPGFVVWKE